MSKIKLIYFKSCPNYLPIKKILDKLNLVYEAFDQEELNLEDEHRKFCSPTLLIDEEIVLGAKSESSGCTLLTIDEEVLIKKIKNKLK